MNIRKFNYGKNKTDTGNTQAIVINDTTFYFSYNTIVAFSVKGEIVVRKNQWGTTTGKHLNWIDGGNKSKRLASHEFTFLLNLILSKPF